METVQGKINKTEEPGGSKPRPSETKVLEPQEGRKGTEWSLVVAGALILALVAFVTGVRMGKGLSDFKHTDASSLRAQAKGQKSPPLAPEVKGMDSQPSREAKIILPEVPEKGKEKEKDLRPSPTQEKAFGEKLSRPAEKAVTPPTEETKATPPPKAKFTLQVGAFNNPEEARELVSQLRSKGYPAYQVTGTAAAKGTLYRVRIGQFQSLPEARQFALAFEKKEKVKTVIASLQ
jgi:cell division septation protein DedD